MYIESEIKLDKTTLVIYMRNEPELKLGYKTLVIYM